MRELEARRQLGPDVRYHHLDEIRDPPAESADGSSLCVLRSKYEIARVATELKNCARSYTDQVQEGEYVLVAMLDAAGRAVALAGYLRQGGRHWDHRPVLRSNQTAPQEIRNRFDGYLPALRYWSRSTILEGWSMTRRKRSLINVPGVGPAMREALVRAGILDMAALAALTTDDARFQAVLTSIQEDPEASKRVRSRMCGHLQQFANDALELLRS
jgi:hypothetical protein